MVCHFGWPIIRGETETGLTIFRPNDGLDEGDIVLQKRTPIGADDTLGTVYFDRLFPMGVEAMLEAADLILAGPHREEVQDEALASYEGWCRDAEARINWSAHAQDVHNLILGCDPAPGAWTLVQGEKVRLSESRLIPARRFAESRASPAPSPGSRRARRGSPCKAAWWNPAASAPLRARS